MKAINVMCYLVCSNGGCKGSVKYFLLYFIIKTEV